MISPEICRKVDSTEDVHNGFDSMLGGSRVCTLRLISPTVARHHSEMRACRSANESNPIGVISVLVAMRKEPIHLIGHIIDTAWVCIPKTIRYRSTDVSPIEKVNNQWDHICPMPFSPTSSMNEYKKRRVRRCIVWSVQIKLEIGAVYGLIDDVCEFLDIVGQGRLRLNNILQPNGHRKIR